MKFIKYTEDLGESRESVAGKRSSRTVYVAVDSISFAWIHDQNQKAEIYPKVGTKHTLYEKTDIDNLRQVLTQGDNP